MYSIEIQIMSYLKKKKLKHIVYKQILSHFCHLVAYKLVLLGQLLNSVRGQTGALLMELSHDYVYHLHNLAFTLCLLLTPPTLILHQT